ncbi:MAG: alkaline phosphatase family protein [Byssovorax sp.]
MPPPKPRVLVVFVDALGPSQLERFGSELGVLPHRKKLSGILGYSSGALPTVLTGVPPAVHGRMCLFSRRKEGDPSILAPLSVLGLLPRVVHERGALRRALGKALSRARGLTGYVQLHRVPPEAFRWLDLPERDDMFQAETIGPARTFLADARKAGLSVYAARWQLPEAERWAEAHAELRKSRPDLAFLYATELDGNLHERGNRDPLIGEVAARIGKRIAHARELLADDGASLTTIVVGDHGMADVDRVVDPRPVLPSLAPAQVFVDSTMIRLWGSPSALDRARLALERSSLPGAWLGRDDLRDRRAPTEGSPFAEALWVMPEGTLLAPSFLGGKVKGMHGYDLGTRSSFAALATDDAGAAEAQAITDIAGVVRSRLGLAA